MKKAIRLLVILAGFLAAIPVSAQYAYIDALKLKDIFDSGDGKAALNLQQMATIAGILEKYRKFGEKEQKSSLAILKKFTNNKFIEPYYSKRIQENMTEASADTAPQTSMDSANPTTGLNATMVADALAQFLIQRVKEELAYDFMQRMDTVLITYPEMEVFLPNTLQTLPNAIKSLNYSVFFSTTTSAFRTDIKEFPRRLVTLPEMEIPKDGGKVAERVAAYKSFFESSNGLAVKVFANIVDGLISGKSITDLVDSLHGIKIPDAADQQSKNIAAAISILKVFTDGIRTAQSEKPWITATDLAALFKDEKLLNIYVGLLFELVIDRTVPEKAKKEDFRSKLNVYANTAGDLIAGLAVITKEIEALESFKASVTSPNQTVDAKLETIRTYMLAVSDFMGYVLTLGCLPQEIGVQAGRAIDGGAESFFANAKEICIQIRDGINVAIFLSRSDYPSAFAVSMRITQDILGYLQADETNKLSAEQRTYLKNLQTDIGLLGSFVAAAAKVSNAEEAAAVISQYALPVASYRQRYLNSLEINLNAYLGIDFARNLTIASSGLDNQGVYAPLGISLCWSIPWNVIDSFAIFFGLIDVGAVASYRLSTSTSTLPDLVWKDLLSESVNVVFGLFQSPVVVGGGIRLGPMIQDSSSAYVNGIPWQIHAFLSVDVPIFRFYSLP